MPFKTEPRMCDVEGCENKATFSAQIVLSTLQRSPKGQLSSKTIALCDSCVSPKAGRWEAFKRSIAFKAWAVRTDMLHKLETPDFKEAATQSEEVSALESPAVADSGTAVEREQVPSSPAVPDGKSAAAGAE